jgi:hypothetical protein
MTTFRMTDACRTESDLPLRSGLKPTRAEALLHTVACVGAVPTHEEPELVAAQLRAWNDFYRPADAHDAYHVEQAARLSVRLKRCWAHDLTVRLLAAERARSCWDQDRRLAAEELGAKLPRNPALISRRLRRSPQGCDWLLERWEALAALLRDGRDWTEAQRTLALDLLGTPAELREGATRLDPAGVAGEALRSSRRAVAEAEIVALRRLRDETLSGLDASERLSAELGYSPEIERPVLLLMQYEAASARRMHRSLDHLARSKRGEGKGEAAPPRRASPAPPRAARSASLARPEPPPAPAPETPVVNLPPAPPLPRDVAGPRLEGCGSLAAGTFGSALGGLPGNRRARRAEQSRQRRG